MSTRYLGKELEEELVVVGDAGQEDPDYFVQESKLKVRLLIPVMRDFGKAI